MNIASIMDAIAEALIPVSTKVYPYPSGSVNVPCFVVGYPEDFDFDFTMGRGSDSATFPIYYIAGTKTDKATRDEISNIISDSDNVKDAIDGDLGGTVSTAQVVRTSIEEIRVGQVSYMSARFDIEIIA